MASPIHAASLHSHDDLTRRIDRLTGAELDALDSYPVQPFVRLDQLAEKMDFLRLASLDRPIDADSADRGNPLDRAALDLVSGLYGLGAAWCFVLKGGASRIDCGFGLDRGDDARQRLGMLLRGVFPGASVDELGWPFPSSQLVKQHQ